MDFSWQGSAAFFGTEDLDASHRFYHEILRLPLYKDQGSCRIYQVPGGGLLGFCRHLSVVHRHKSPIITLLTPAVDQVYEHLIQGSFRPKTEPQLNPQFNIYHFFLEDPSGYTVEIQTFLDPEE